MRVRGIGSNAYQVTTFEALLTLLKDTSVTNLANTGVPFGPGDFTGAFQWTRTFAVGESKVFWSEATINAYLLESSCGDHEVHAPDLCDDGFADACGTCNATCDGVGTGAGACGDASLCPEFETCDDGFTDACGTCNATCDGAGAGAMCGDNATCPEFEACDDGNTTSNDGCSATCDVEMPLVPDSGVVGDSGLASDGGGDGATGGGDGGCSVGGAMRDGERAPAALGLSLALAVLTARRRRAKV